MNWPLANSGPGEVLIYYWLLWLLIVAGPVVAWIAVYYFWLKRRWDPYFRATEKDTDQRHQMEGSNASD